MFGSFAGSKRVCSFGSLGDAVCSRPGLVPWHRGTASIVVDFSSVSKRERRAFLVWNTISIIIGLTGLSAFYASFIATSFDARVSVGLAALLVAAVGFYFCWKTANRHGAMLIASNDKAC